MNIIVTGSNGQLGHAIREVLTNHEVLYTDTDNVDITKPEQIEEVFNNFKPEFLIHGAAYTNVDGCEEEVELAEMVNTRGTENLAQECKKINIPMVYVSTDYVFDGTSKKPYKEEEKPNPQSVYGRTKLGGEEAVRRISKWYIVRTSWVYGEGNNFIRTMISLSEKMDELSIVNDQVGRPTNATDLAKALKDIIEKRPEYGIYHIQNDGPEISWAEFAKKIFELANKDTKVKEITTEEYLSDKQDKKIAKRPAYSVLNLEKSKNAGLFIEVWQKSLQKYISKE